jgi:hypothetical protein
VGYIAGYSFSLSRQLVVSPNGKAALVNTFTAEALFPIPNSAVTPGGSAYAGFQISFSNATTPKDLEGAFINYGLGGGDGLGGGLDYAIGRGGIVQLTGTGGLAAGGSGQGLTKTISTVTPICGT